MSLESDKQALRRRMRGRLRAISPQEREQAGRRIIDVVLLFPLFRSSMRIAFFAALPSEVPTRLLFERARAAGKTCLMPRCIPGDRLEFCELETWSQLAPGAFGVLEPKREIQPTSIGADDLVLVPGLAFSPQGDRLGRGRGYYDRTFDRRNVPDPALIGLCFDSQIEPELPHGPLDRRMDAVVSESGVVARPHG